jgi:hypothetical protein
MSSTELPLIGYQENQHIVVTWQSLVDWVFGENNQLKNRKHAGFAGAECLF